MLPISSKHLAAGRLFIIVDRIQVDNNSITIVIEIVFKYRKVCELPLTLGDKLLETIIKINSMEADRKVAKKTERRD